MQSESRGQWMSCSQENKGQERLCLNHSSATHYRVNSFRRLQIAECLSFLICQMRVVVNDSIFLELFAYLFHKHLGTLYSRYHCRFHAVPGRMPEVWQALSVKNGHRPLFSLGDAQIHSVRKEKGKGRDLQSKGPRPYFILTSDFSELFHL